MKEQIEKFKLNNNIYVWEYIENTRNFSGCNITFEKNAGNDLIKLLNLMISCEWSTKKTLKSVSPDIHILNSVNNRKGLAEWKSKPHIILSLKKNEDENLWKIINHEDYFEFQFGTNKAIEFQKSIEFCLIGKNDFAISDNAEENILYFW